MRARGRSNVAIDVAIPLKLARTARRRRRWHAPGCRALLLAVLAACSDGGTGAAAQANAPAFVTRDSAGVQIVENPGPRWSGGLPWRVVAESVFEIGAADGAETDQLYGVQDAIRLEDGSIAIADGGTNRIRIYDRSGRHVRDLGGPGGGPGEFGMLAGIGMAGGRSIAAWDARRKRLTHFDPDGRVTHEVAADPRHRLGLVSPAVGWFAAGTPVITPGFAARDLLAVPPGERRAPEYYLHVRLDGGIDTVAVLRGREEFVIRQGRSLSAPPLPFGRASHAAAGGDAFFGGESDRFEVRQWSPGGELRRVIRAAIEPRPVTPEHLARYEAERQEAGQRRGRVAALLGAFSAAADPEEADLPHRETLPFFDRIVVDRSGHLWVKEFGFDREPGRWQVFGSDGGWLGALSTPAGFRITDVGHDYVLGVAIDSLGVERVRLYALER
jgi:hypothetical protein